MRSWPQLHDLCLSMKLSHACGQPKMSGSWWRDLTECGPLEKGMASHSSIVAWSQKAPARLGFPGGPDGKESACNAGDLGSIPGSSQTQSLTMLNDSVCV